MGRFRIALAVAGLAASWAVAASPACAGDFTMAEALSYPFVSDLVAAERIHRIAWVRTVRGVRNVFVADGPGFVPRQVTRFADDDGQELTDLAFSPDGSALAFVRGGDHDENWPAQGDLAPDPTSSPEQPKESVWVADPSGRRPARAIGEGDGPALSMRGALAFVRDHQIWTAKLDGSGSRRLFFDRGKDESPRWSPDGSRLAFVSDRDDHAFIGVWSGADRPIVYLAPSTGRDGEAAWSPDSRRIAFVRQPGKGGAPEPLLAQTPRPWAIWSADAATGAGHVVWESPDTLRGSHPQVAGAANLAWAAGDRLVFVAEMDNWPHLYIVPESGGPARLLTPGAFMVEHVSPAPDGRTIVYSANGGRTPGDEDRRHLFSLDLASGAATELTAGAGLEWAPAALDSEAAFIAAGTSAPPAIEVIDLAGRDRRELADQAPPPDFPATAFVAPRLVSFRAADGLRIEGQLFGAPDAAGPQPGVIFVHGGPPRQMLLGWHYMDYYANSYAVNEYLAAHGFTVLSVNYRLGIGYGHDFQHPEHAGPAGAAEYQDVLAGARYLQSLPGVDPARIGIWGGSYGGYLTALALARNSDVFKAGVDMHGLHDWTLAFGAALAPATRYEQGDRAAAMAMAWRSSPDADIDHWRSPVLLIQGDDDRNVHFAQMIDVSRRLQARGIPFEELVLPNEIHGFLRWASWLRADEATADFLRRKLRAGGDQANR
ncbi:MAG TPA: prolyl oligopeptidase family serine peptidase [Caulobacteraceae bacterium]|nr:prolyl oligopeptidase family serine peptidase [Caulobacteraceae bacterium]